MRERSEACFVAGDANGSTRESEIVLLSGYDAPGMNLKSSLPYGSNCTISTAAAAFLFDSLPFFLMSQLYLDSVVTEFTCLPVSFTYVILCVTPNARPRNPWGGVISVNQVKEHRHESVGPAR